MLIHQVTARNPVTVKGKRIVLLPAKVDGRSEPLQTQSLAFQNPLNATEAQSLFLILSKSLVIPLTANRCNCPAFSISGSFCALSNIWCRLNIDFYTFWNTVKNVPMSWIIWGVSGGHSSFLWFLQFDSRGEITPYTLLVWPFSNLSIQRAFSRTTPAGRKTPLNLLSSVLSP